MIKPLTGTELSSCKPRSGMSSISDLLPRLIRSYELQAELVKRRSEPATPIITTDETSINRVQETFAWYD